MAQHPPSVLSLLECLLDIVEKKLKTMLACIEVEDTTQCTILPGPNGELGIQDLMDQLVKKETKGTLSDEQGEKGEKLRRALLLYWN